MRRELEAWNGRRVVVSGVAAWALLASLVCWAGLGLAGLLGAGYWLRTGLFLLALPSLLTIIVVPILGRHN